MQLVPGMRIGSYTLERMVGVGAFSVVWMADDGARGGKVAIKVMHPHAMSSENVERFRREAWALSQVKSPHIARMYEFFEGPPVMALVMEFIEGEQLSEVLRRMRFDIDDAVKLGIDLVSGIVEMHARGIIHRDIKPENVILRPVADERGWEGVIFDFNLSRTRPPGSKVSSITTMHTAIGTVPFMAPEQLLDARRVTEASDVYALGAILYRAVAGVPPFAAEENLRAKIQQEAPALPLHRSDPAALRFTEIVSHALRRRPADRYVTAQIMRTDLVALRAQLQRQSFLHG